jgi:hypothetical protein
MDTEKHSLKPLWSHAYGLAPIEANPIEAKGKKWENIPIQANPRNSVVTSETRIQIRINIAVAAIKLYILNLWLNENDFSVSLVGVGTDFWFL